MKLDFAKAAKVLNQMKYLGREDWECDDDGGGVHAGGVVLLTDSHAIETAEGYVAMLASQGCLPNLDSDEDQSKPEAAKSTAMPSTDEALGIINEAEHSDATWSIIALGHDESGEISAFLLYEELIGTAMYYKAKDQQS